MFLVNEPVDRFTDLQHLFSPGKTRLRKELVVCQRLDDSCQKLFDVYSRGDINVSQLEAKGKKGVFQQCRFDCCPATISTNSTWQLPKLGTQEATLTSSFSNLEHPYLRALTSFVVPSTPPQARP